jgi:hypothetical protein
VSSALRIARSIVIDRHIDEVFAFVAEPRNDPRWCKKVEAVEQVAGDGPGPGSRYEVVHRPIRLRPARRMAYECLDWEPPARIRWREHDGDDVIDVAYELESVWTATRITQVDDARLAAPRLLRPVLHAGIGRDVGRQLRALKRLLERGVRA